SVDIGPFAGWLSRRELTCVAVVIETLDKAIDPSEAQRLVERVLIGDRFHSRMILEKDKPDAAARSMILFEPPPPILAAPDLSIRDFCCHRIHPRNRRL